MIVILYQNGDGGVSLRDSTRGFHCWGTDGRSFSYKDAQLAGDSVGTVASAFRSEGKKHCEEDQKLSTEHIWWVWYLWSGISVICEEENRRAPFPQTWSDCVSINRHSESAITVKRGCGRCINFIAKMNSQFSLKWWCAEKWENSDVVAWVILHHMLHKWANASLVYTEENNTGLKAGLPQCRDLVALVCCEDAVAWEGPT